VLVYFDSSALVKLVVDEQGSDLVVEIWDACTAACASRLGYPEVRAALAAAARHGTLSRSRHNTAKAEWERYWSAVRPVEMTLAVERSAGAAAESFRLRGADAVHLASALALEDPQVLVVAWDRRLREGALAAGLTVAPRTIDGE
jgi:predicted nucleic acid-binding protein